ncbi:MAG: hypothetical protein DWQ31_18360 [Planctomycetota bacterium]|nr:MAG: hypothetical protein DWQ31_18360 [Planctomycetota bacterium]REJ87328.1 MAG: hypothetical protein DWQ35_21700 [Planctomycetota bacterium]REK42508.1 MAG: hypothetical protein DWQ46_13045 [Planctomycetota bacterium]
MPTRTRKEWNRAKSGQYERQLGWKRSRNGIRVQAKFFLGTDTREAKQRDERLRMLWSLVEDRSPERPALWPSDALDVAKAIAKGQGVVEVDRLIGLDTEDGLEPPGSYAARIHSLQIHYPVMPFKPNDVEAYSRGLQKNALTVSGFQHTNRIAEAMNNDLMAHLVGPQSPMTAPVGGPTLHEAMRAYIEWLKIEYFDAESRHVTAWGMGQIKQMQRLIKHHSDVPLSALDFNMLESLIGYWRRRPIREGSDKQIASSTAGNHIKQLKVFSSWLHRSPEYEWRKPRDFDSISSKIMTNSEDFVQSSEQVETFSLDELVLINKYATPFERILVLLALNCGFGTAETATLTVNELHLFEALDKRTQVALNFESSNNDSFIKRIRRKNKVYGEFILFPQTVIGLQWALEQRRQQPGFCSKARLLLNGKHEPLDKPTKGGHRNQQIPNAFTRLLKRITADGNTIRELSFGKLRKTAGNLIRQVSDGEISEIFLCHANPVRAGNLLDVYTNRPFGKVFRAIQEVERLLQPVFEAAGPEPFQAGPQAYTPLSTVERIYDMHETGAKPRAIAEELGVSVSTVYRQLRKR